MYKREREQSVLALSLMAKRFIKESEKKQFALKAMRAGEREREIYKREREREYIGFSPGYRQREGENKYVSFCICIYIHTYILISTFFGAFSAAHRPHTSSDVPHVRC